MYLRDLKGLKFPDNAVIKFFFKNALHTQGGRVLELACSNGNNLQLFANYNYECWGVDLDAQNIQNANFNFKEVLGVRDYRFFCEDIFDFAKRQSGVEADIFLIPNVINYFSREAFLELLRLSRQNALYKKNALFFLRTRSIKDYRYGLGEKIAHNSFRIPLDEDTTGEAGCINTLYQEHELVEYLKEFLNLCDFKVLSYESTNIMGDDDRLVNDSDIVIYGRIS